LRVEGLENLPLRGPAVLAANHGSGPACPVVFEVVFFPRDPAFEEKAGRVLDLYERCWQGKPLAKVDFVISTDEKTSIQARRRRHPSLAPAPHRSMRVEHEYVRRGAWAYLAAWDVHRAKIFGRCERTSHGRRSTHGCAASIVIAMTSARSVSNRNTNTSSILS
jgi:hypothetical protein